MGCLDNLLKITRGVLYTPEFDAYVAPARAYPQVWRLLAGILLFTVFFALPMVALFVSLSVFGTSRAAIGTIIEARTPVGVAVMLGILTPSIVGLWIGVRWLHKRSLFSLVGGSFSVVWDNFEIAALLFTVLQCLNLFFVSFFYPLSANLSLDVWLIWLPFIIILLLLQTGAEELGFRGYLMQQLAARFQNPLWWFILPQIVFALIHFTPGVYGELAWVVVIQIFFFALIMADLTRVTGNLGAAWGLHFANNFMIFMIACTTGNGNGASLFTLPFEAHEIPMPLLLVGFFTQVASWGLLRHYLRPIGAGEPD